MTWFCYLPVRSRDTHMIASSFCTFKINSTERKGLKTKQIKHKTKKRRALQIQDTNKGWALKKSIL